MAKLSVIDELEDTQVPFLRGILTGSLQSAGLAFNEAYAIADEVRDALASERQVTTERLRALVAAKLEASGNDAVLQRYAIQPPAGGHVKVVTSAGIVRPFSRAQHARTLIVSGVPRETARAVSESIYRQLLDAGEESVLSTHLVELTRQQLLTDVSKRAAKRYLAWVEFQRGGRPLIVLIGGTSGVGKSTAAVEIARRLSIVRTQSTDMLREVMRMMLPERLLPVLHVSSFEAWQRGAMESTPGESSEQSVAHGFSQQAQLVGVAADAVITRALTERVSVILEGVHINPQFMERLRGSTDAIVVPVVLGVLKRTTLKERLGGRGKRTRTRASRRYLDGFDEIWKLQTFLLAEADRCGVPIVQNIDEADTTDEVVALVVDAIAAQASEDLEHRRSEPG